MVRNAVQPFQGEVRFAGQGSSTGHMHQGEKLLTDATLEIFKA